MRNIAIMISLLYEKKRLLLEAEQLSFIKSCDIFKATGNFNGSSCVLNRSCENLAYFSINIDTLCELVSVFLQINSHLKTLTALI